MKKIEYIQPAVIVKNVASMCILTGSLNSDNPISGLDPDPLEPGNPGDIEEFSKQNLTINDVWED